MTICENTYMQISTDKKMDTLDRVTEKTDTQMDTQRRTNKQLDR